MSDVLEEIYDNEPVCPYCGHHMSDAWELSLEDGDSETIECGECLKEYSVTLHISIDYTSKAVKP